MPAATLHYKDTPQDEPSNKVVQRLLMQGERVAHITPGKTTSLRLPAASNVPIRNDSRHSGQAFLRYSCGRASAEASAEELFWLQHSDDTHRSIAHFQLASPARKARALYLDRVAACGES